MGKRGREKKRLKKGKRRRIDNEEEGNGGDSQLKDVSEALAPKKSSSCSSKDSKKESEKKNNGVEGLEANLDSMTAVEGVYMGRSDSESFVSGNRESLGSTPVLENISSESELSVVDSSETDDMPDENEEENHYEASIKSKLTAHEMQPFFPREEETGIAQVSHIDVESCVGLDVVQQLQGRLHLLKTEIGTKEEYLKSKEAQLKEMRNAVRSLSTTVGSLSKKEMRLGRKQQTLQRKLAEVTENLASCKRRVAITSTEIKNSEEVVKGMESEVACIKHDLLKKKMHLHKCKGTLSELEVEINSKPSFVKGASECQGQSSKIIEKEPESPLSISSSGCYTPSVVEYLGMADDASLSEMGRFFDIRRSFDLLTAVKDLGEPFSVTTPEMENRVVFKEHKDSVLEDRVNTLRQRYSTPLLSLKSYRLKQFFRTRSGHKIGSVSFTNRIDVLKPICSKELESGQCDTDDCCFQHRADYECSSDDVLKDLIEYQLLWNQEGKLREMGASACDVELIDLKAKYGSVLTSNEMCLHVANKLESVDSVSLSIARLSDSVDNTFSSLASFLACLCEGEIDEIYSSPGSLIKRSVKLKGFHQSFTPDKDILNCGCSSKQLTEREKALDITAFSKGRYFSNRESKYYFENYIKMGKVKNVVPSETFWVKYTFFYLRDGLLKGDWTTDDFKVENRAALMDSIGVLKRGLAVYPQSVDLWLLLLRISSCVCDVDEVRKEFENCFSKIGFEYHIKLLNLFFEPEYDNKLFISDDMLVVLCQQRELNLNERKEVDVLLSHRITEVVLCQVQFDINSGCTSTGVEYLRKRLVAVEAGDKKPLLWNYLTTEDTFFLISCLINVLVFNVLPSFLFSSEIKPGTLIYKSPVLVDWEKLAKNKLSYAVWESLLDTALCLVEKHIPYKVIVGKLRKHENYFYVNAVSFFFKFSDSLTKKKVLRRVIKLSPSNEVLCDYVSRYFIGLGGRKENVSLVKSLLRGKCSHSLKSWFTLSQGYVSLGMQMHAKVALLYSFLHPDDTAEDISLFLSKEQDVKKISEDLCEKRCYLILRALKVEEATEPEIELNCELLKEVQLYINTSFLCALCGLGTLTIKTIERGLAVFSSPSDLCLLWEWLFELLLQKKTWDRNDALYGMKLCEQMVLCFMEMSDKASFTAALFSANDLESDYAPSERSNPEMVFKLVACLVYRVVLRCKDEAIDIDKGAFLERLASLCPRNQYILIHLSWHYISIGELELALLSLRDSMKRHPENYVVIEYYIKALKFISQSKKTSVAVRELCKKLIISAYVNALNTNGPVFRIWKDFALFAHVDCASCISETSEGGSFKIPPVSDILREAEICGVCTEEISREIRNYPVHYLAL
eukprot:Nk52_evm15s1444 gene=Nk52_evmTU15s1444